MSIFRFDVEQDTETTAWSDGVQIPVTIKSTAVYVDDSFILDYDLDTTEAEPWSLANGRTAIGFASRADCVAQLAAIEAAIVAAAPLSMSGRFDICADDVFDIAAAHLASIAAARKERATLIPIWA